MRFSCFSVLLRNAEVRWGGEINRLLQFKMSWMVFWDIVYKILDKIWFGRVEPPGWEVEPPAVFPTHPAPPAANEMPIKCLSRWYLLFAYHNNIWLSYASAMTGQSSRVTVSGTIPMMFHTRWLSAAFIMVGLRNRADHYIFILWFLLTSSSFFLA